MSDDPVRLVAIDLETTGLDPVEDRILEVGAVSMAQSNLALGARFNLLTGEDCEPCEPEVLTMHTDSGLLDEQALLVDRHTAFTVGEVDKQLAHWLYAHYGGLKPWVVGRNPAFDLGFIERHLPKSFERLHYRKLDVTAYSLLAEQAPDWFTAGMPEGRRLHRALPDAEDAAVAARWWWLGMGALANIKDPPHVFPT